MNTLIRVNDIEQYKVVYDGLKGAKNAEGFILEAQLADVRPWLSDPMLNELLEQRVNNTLTEANRLLLFGGSYVYNGVTYMTLGVAAALAYYAYGRAIFRGGVSLTYGGAVLKNSDFSDPLSDVTKATMRKEAVAMAEAIKQDVLIMVGRKYSDYPLLRVTNKTKKRRQLIKIVGQ